MDTIGNRTITRITIQENHGLQLGFTAMSNLSLGQVVELTATGGIDKISASTVIPLGLVIKGAVAGERATVLTRFTAKILAVANEDLLINDNISVASYDEVNNVDKYKKSATNDYVVGVALGDATAEGSVEVGILRFSYKKS